MREDTTLNTATRFDGQKAKTPSAPASDAGFKDAEDTLHTILSTLDNAKAEDVTSISLHNRSTLADFMVIATGRSQRHVDAIAAQILDALAERGKINVRVEGRPLCEWVLIDEGNVVVHIFHPESRAFYNLDKMWSEARPSERSVA